jgi:type VI protein secretion system component VasK
LGSNEARADRSEDVVARAAKVAWRDAGGFALKLDMMEALQSCRAPTHNVAQRLLYLPFSSSAEAGYAACDSAYLSALHEGFVRPALKLLEERLAAAPRPGDGKADAVRAYVMLGSAQVGDLNWLATQVRTLMIDAMLREDPLLPADAPGRSLKGRLWNPTYHYLNALHDHTLPPEKVDKALLERARAAVKSSGK